MWLVLGKVWVKILCWWVDEIYLVVVVVVVVM